MLEQIAVEFLDEHTEVGKALSFWQDHFAELEEVRIRFCRSWITICEASNLTTLAANLKEFPAYPGAAACAAITARAAC